MMSITRAGNIYSIFEGPNDHVENSEITRADTKTIILTHIGKYPGIRYRELLRATGLTNGTLEYHLKMLEKSNSITVERRDGRRARYFPICIPADETQILGYIRNDVARQIVFYVLGHDLCTFKELPLPPLGILKGSLKLG